MDWILLLRSLLAASLIVCFVYASVKSCILAYCDLDDAINNIDAIFTPIISILVEYWYRDNWTMFAKLLVIALFLVFSIPTELVWICVQLIRKCFLKKLYT